RMLSERLGKWSFWMMFVAFNVTFFPMHLLGLDGMPRRVWTYDSGLGWDTLNMLVSAGSGFFGLGTAITFFNVAWSHFRGEPAPADPWGADTLEWATPSPTPHYNFAAVPVVASRHPLWDDGGLSWAASSDDPQTSSAGVEGALARTTPWTSGIDTGAEGALDVPGDTFVPFLVACAVGLVFLGLLLQFTVIWVL